MTDTGHRAEDSAWDPNISADDLRGLLVALPVGVVVVDRDGLVVLANREADEKLSATGESVVGQPLGLPLVGLQQRTTLELPRADGTYTVITGTTRDVEWRGQAAVLLAFTDITDRFEREEDLRRSEERYALAVRGASDGLWDWDLEEGLLHVSNRWLDLLGLGEWADDDFDPSFWLDRCHPTDLPRVLQALEVHLGGDEHTFSVEHRLRNRDGDWMWMLARGRAVFADDGAPVRIAGSLTDIGARKVLEERLVHEARHDALTGLANRRQLIEDLDAILARCRRTPRAFGVGVLDLDGFKEVNDRLGHEAGDRLLIEVSRRLQACIRPGDVAARLGGDEFALLLPDLSDDNALASISARIEAGLGREHVIDGAAVVVRASIGLVAVHDFGVSASALLREADRAMYRSKASGRPEISR